jgi:hypothetical protein
MWIVVWMTPASPLEAKNTLLIGLFLLLLHEGIFVGGIAFMRNELLCAHMMICNGPRDGGCMLHNPHYDFNDEVLPLGASYWVKLVETRLAG